MAVLNFFKKRKAKKEKVEKKEKPAKKEEKEEKKTKEVKPVEGAKEGEVWEKRPPKIKKREGAGRAHRVLMSPQITEKATSFAEKGQYIFKVYSGANKTEIKKAVEDLYGVDAVSIKIIKVPKKQRRVGRHLGWRKGYKKAIIKIGKGQKIEVLPR